MEAATARGSGVEEQLAPFAIRMLTVAVAVHENVPASCGSVFEAVHQRDPHALCKDRRTLGEAGCRTSTVVVAPHGGHRRKLCESAENPLPDIASVEDAIAAHKGGQRGVVEVSVRVGDEAQSHPPSLARRSRHPAPTA